MSVYRARYRSGSNWRTITLVAKSKKEAQEIADRRLNEQYGPQPIWEQAQQYGQDGEPLIENNNPVYAEQWVYRLNPVIKGQERPDLMQEHYEFVDIELVRKEGNG